MAYAWRGGTFAARSHGLLSVGRPARNPRVPHLALVPGRVFGDLKDARGRHYFYTLDSVPGEQLPLAGSASGTGVTDAAAAPAGAASATAAASGAGVTDAASSPAGQADAPVIASGAGVTDAATAPAATASGYAIVTLVAPINTGPGSIAFFSNFVGTPAAGDTVRYPTANGFQVLTDGTCVANVNSGSYDCFYNDGTGEVAFTVTLVDFVAAWGAGVTDTATAPDASLYGGVNIDGTGVTDTTSAPGGSVTVGVVGSGAGATATTEVPSATATGTAAAAGAGVTVDATAPTGVGETVAEAQGSGVEATASAPTGSGAGDLEAAGDGVTVTATAPIGSARGDRRVGDIPMRVLTIVPPQQKLSRAA